jgi:serine/threonine protein kinase
MLPTQLGAGSFRSFQDVLERFEDAWQTGIPRLEDFLCADGLPRMSLIVELIKIDLDHRWRVRDRGSGPPGDTAVPCLEAYIERFPELGPLEQLPADLIQEEYHVRQCWGDRPGRDEFLKRFGNQVDRVRELLDQVDAELRLESAGVRQASLRNDAAPAVPVASPILAVDSVLSFIEALRALPLLKPAHLNEVFRENLQGRFAEPRDLARDLEERGWLTAFQVNQVMEGHGADLVLDNYLLLDRLGKGATGEVFKARHLRMDRLAAVKVIRPELLTETEVLERFYREIEAAGRLSHANIVAAYDAGPAGRTHFFAMEYVEGTDLDRLVKQSGSLPACQACDYVRQAALGLQHAHERGLVHRDIKPANLLLSTRGLVKVLDLGLARLHQSLAESRWGGGTTLQGTIIGTPDYMAPEQVDNPHQVDIRADIYSLGCTLYYLLNGRVPFGGSTIFEKLLKIQQAEPTPLEELRADLPPELGLVLRRMMAKSPEERYQTPAELAAALATYSGTNSAIPPIAAHQTGIIGSSTQTMLRRRAKHRWLLACGLVALLALGLLLLALRWLSADASRTASQVSSDSTRHAHRTEPTLVDGSFEIPSVAKARWLDRGGPEYGFAFNPSGSAWTFSGDAPVWQDGAYHYRSGGIYTGSSGLAGNDNLLTKGNPPAPDGKQVAFLQMKCSIRQVVEFPPGRYTIRFLSAQRAPRPKDVPPVQPGSQTIQVSVDSRVVGKFTPARTNYELCTTDEFQVTAGKHVLVFTGLNDPNGGDNLAFVDQVRIDVTANSLKTTAR